MHSGNAARNQCESVMPGSITGTGVAVGDGGGDDLPRRLAPGEQVFLREVGELELTTGLDLAAVALLALAAGEKKKQLLESIAGWAEQLRDVMAAFNGSTFASSLLPIAAESVDLQAHPDGPTE